MRDLENIYFDWETGEILENPYSNEHLETIPYNHPKEQIKSPFRNHKLLSECKTEEEILEACNDDAYLSGSIGFDGDKLFSIVTSKIVPFDGIHQFRAMQLASLIVARNAAIATTDKIADTIGVSKNHLTRELQPLIDSGFIKVYSPSGRTSKNRVILFNPFFFWRGDYSVRNMVRNRALSTGEWQLDKRKSGRLELQELEEMINPSYLEVA